VGRGSNGVRAGYSLSAADSSLDISNAFTRRGGIMRAVPPSPELIDSHPKQYPQTVLKQFWPKYEVQKSEISKTRSAIFWADQLNVPLPYYAWRP
jgi:hypothetical protein